MINNNSERMLDIMAKIDNKYIEEYAEENISKKRKQAFSWKKVLPAAACIALLLVSIPIVNTFMEREPSPVVDNPHINEPLNINGFVVQDGILMSYTGDETKITIPNEVQKVSSEAFANNLTASTIEKITTNKIVFEANSLAPLSSLKSIEVLNSTANDVSKAIDTAFDSTVEKLVSNGVSLKYEYSENGGTPVYSSNVKDILFAFGDREVGNPLTGKEKPTKIYIASPEVTVAEFLRVGMNPSEAKKYVTEWDDIYFNTDSMYYYTVKNIGDKQYTCVWEMTEDQYDAWLSNIGLNDTYINSPKKYYKPYADNDIGVVVDILIEKTVKIS